MKKYLIFFLIIASTLTHAHELQVLSWNVFMIPKPWKSSLQNTRSRVIPTQLAELNHDVILLQEAFPSGFRTKVARALRKSHPHKYYLRIRSFPFPFYGSGLFALSRYPLKLIDRVYFNTCTASDCFASKGATLLEVELPGGKKAHLVNTHLQATDAAGPIRLKQLGQIHEMLARSGSRNIPQFLVGDLNIDPSEPEFTLGLSLLGMDFSRITGPILQTSSRMNPCYKTGTRPQWVDHMWFGKSQGTNSSALRVVDLEFDYKGLVCPSSDHHAVEGNFYL